MSPDLVGEKDKYADNYSSVTREERRAVTAGSWRRGAQSYSPSSPSMHAVFW